MPRAARHGTFSKGQDTSNNICCSVWLPFLCLLARGWAAVPGEAQRVLSVATIVALATATVGHWRKLQTRPAYALPGSGTVTCGGAQLTTG